MRINLITIKRIWFDRIPGAINIVAKNPLNLMTYMGGLDQSIGYIPVPEMASLYNQLSLAGLPVNWSSNAFATKARGVTIIGPQGVIPFKVITASCNVMGGSIVDAPFPASAAGEYADTAVITNAFNQINPSYSIDGSLVTGALAGNLKNTSSVSAQNQYQDAPSSIVSKSRNANYAYRLNVAGNILRNFSNQVESAGSYLAIGGFAWDSAQADVELPIITDASCTAMVQTQWQVEIEDNLISQAASQTGRLYAVFGTGTLAYADPNLTGNACMSPTLNISGICPTVACAIDVTNDAVTTDTLTVNDWNSVFLGAADLTLVGGVQIQNELSPIIFF